MNDLQGKVVLVTGGTRGIGLATALSFGRQGAICYLTHRWGSADEDAIRARFAAVGAPVPRIVEADVANDDDTAALLERIAAEFDGVHAFISNAAFGPVTRGLKDYKRRGLLRGIEYSAWPLCAYTLAIRERFGAPPRYVIGMSAVGVRQLSPNYDLVAAAKAVLETLAKYLDYRLFEEDVNINVLCPRWVRTDALRATFGEEFEAFVAQYPRSHQFIEVGEVADAALALCSGLMDGVRGQVITVDHGHTFSDNLMRLYSESLATRREA